MNDQCKSKLCDHSFGLSRLFTSILFCFLRAPKQLQAKALSDATNVLLDDTYYGIVLNTIILWYCGSTESEQLQCKVFILDQNHKLYYKINQIQTTQVTE